jgi:hypothetical protein
VINILLFILHLEIPYKCHGFCLPVDAGCRKCIDNLKLTEIGSYGLPRNPRPGVPAHVHTGIDIRRPSANYIDEPVYPIFSGTVISKRDDGPYAQIILEHRDHTDYQSFTIFVI